jgi:hypothetical protein
MTPLTDEVLRRRLEDRAAAGPAISLSAIARSVAAQPRHRSVMLGWRGRAGVLGSAAAVLLLSVAVFAGLLSRSGPAGIATGSARLPTPPGTSPATASPAPSAAIDAWASITWNEVDPAAFQSDETVVNDGIAVGDGFVVVGTTRSGDVRTGRIWRSTDGRTWDRSDAPAASPMVPVRIVALDDTLILFGIDLPRDGTPGKRYEIWSSRDGANWTTGPALPEGVDVSSAAAGPDGILAVGTQQTFLLGPDLTSWTRTASWSDPGMMLGRPAWADGRWVLPATTGTDANGSRSRAVVFTSDDAINWQPATVEQPEGGMFRVLAAQGGLVGVGTSGDVCRTCFGTLITSNATWSSADGSIWRPVDLKRVGMPPGPFYDFQGDGHRIIAIASGEIPRVVLLGQTLDGATWAEIDSGAGKPAGQLVIGARGVVVLPVGGTGGTSISGAFVPHVWYGAASSVPAGSGPVPSAMASPGPSASGSADPSPIVIGCDTLGFDARRCAAVVARARAQAGNPTDVVTIVIRPAKFDPGLLGGQPLATVEFAFADGTTKTVVFGCMVGSEDELACSNDPQIGISNGVSHDVPCGATPGDENHPCATLPPSPKPAVVAASTPLVVPTFDVPIDHVGHYEILVGDATLPDGLLSERSGTLADSRPAAYWIDGGVQIVVRPGPPCTGTHCPEIDSIYHAPFGGPQPVHVYLVFDVTQLETPGAVLEVRNLVVR